MHKRIMVTWVGAAEPGHVHACLSFRMWVWRVSIPGISSVGAMALMGLVSTNWKNSSGPQRVSIGTSAERRVQSLQTEVGETELDITSNQK